MCAIIDANVLHEMFGAGRTEAGFGFRQWVAKGKGVLVVGGEVSKELERNLRFRRWMETVAREGRLRTYGDDRVSDEERIVRAMTDERGQAVCRSNDQHVVALARVSGARLLYTNDRELHRDFKNSKLIKDGKIYTTAKNSEFTQSKRDALRNAKCPARPR